MIGAYCVDDITVVRIGARDEWNMPSSTTEIARKAYVDWTQRLVKNLKGEEVMAKGTVYMPFDENLTHEDMIKINGKEYAIINIKPGKDFSQNHQEVYIE